MVYQRWSEDENETLRQLVAQNASWTQISNVILRDPYHIKRHAKPLGLMPHRYTDAGRAEPKQPETIPMKPCTRCGNHAVQEAERFLRWCDDCRDWANSEMNAIA